MSTTTHTQVRISTGKVTSGVYVATPGLRLAWPLTQATELLAQATDLEILIPIALACQKYNYNSLLLKEMR